MLPVNDGNKKSEKNSDNVTCSYCEGTNLRILSCANNAVTFLCGTCESKSKLSFTDKEKTVACKYVCITPHDEEFVTKPVAKRARPIRVGYAYLLKTVGINPERYKIGRTIDLDRRMHELNRPNGTTAPFEHELVASIKVSNCVQMEIKLHKIFDEYRVNGEWFDLPPTELENLTIYMQDGGEDKCYLPIDELRKDIETVL